MYNNVHFLRRTSELKGQLEMLGKLGEEVNRFIRKTEKYAMRNVEVQMNPIQVQELKFNLQKLEGLLLDYETRVHKASKINIKRWERDHLRGQRDDLVGARRKIISSLKKAQKRIRFLRLNADVYERKGRALTISLTAEQLQNHIDPQTGKFNAGGDVIFAVTLLLAFVVELTVRKRRELE